MPECWVRSANSNPNRNITGEVCEESIAGMHDWRHRRLVHPGVVSPAILSQHVPASWHVLVRR